MKSVWLVVIAIVLLALIGGSIWLFTWDIPAPQQSVEQELSDDIIND
ncbi:MULTISPECIES: hypothetical protein [Iodidimonas]|jgi:uncharacterized protein YpmB|uniref:Uncharacterized protein n=1 Tax=Iodidimonas nitroreducens TaxID=1236968 RepID=A0A5A7ND41_9PROT|nr:MULTISPECIES: hypothetical protein [Iodidimonas]GAK34655.1 hypothetical protein AQ1_02557 [alpha proteobacterium Q-1]GER05420.1 hypothetical protein JCM17846_31020 [Iodidimonas nitroreducens]